MTPRKGFASIFVAGLFSFGAAGSIGERSIDLLIFSFSRDTIGYADMILCISLWTDIGEPWPAGSSMEVSPGSWNVTGAGHDIWGQSDSFHFYNFERNTDVTVTAFIESWETSHDWAKGGIMIRDSLDANSSHAMLASTGLGYVSMFWRASTNDITRNSNDDIGTKRVWLRMVKEGSKFTSYMKLEAQQEFEKFYERQVEFANDSFFVGIGVTSHRQGYPASLIVRNFEILDKIWVPIPPAHLGKYLSFI